MNPNTVPTEWQADVIMLKAIIKNGFTPTKGLLRHIRMDMLLHSEVILNREYIENYFEERRVV